MNIQITEIFRCLAALLAGGLIGYVFGTIQQIALRRNEKRQESGKLNNGWAVMPGSGRRVAYLLIALVLVQLICPLFFVNGSDCSSIFPARRLLDRAALGYFVPP